MPEFKVNIGDPKSGKTYKKILTEDACKPFVGKKMGDKIKGELVELPGYELEITGGSDYCGFPMRQDVKGPARKRVLVTEGFGLHKHRKHPIRKGMRKRRTVAGNTIYTRTAQINLKVIKHGKAPLGEVKEEAQVSDGEKPKAEPEVKAPKAEEKKETPKVKKPEEKQEAVKKEDKKEEAKTEKKDAPGAKEEAKKPEAKAEEKASKAAKEGPKIPEAKAPEKA